MIYRKVLGDGCLIEMCMDHKSVYNKDMRGFTWVVMVGEIAHI